MPPKKKAKAGTDDKAPFGSYDAGAVLAQLAEGHSISVDQVRHFYRTPAEPCPIYGTCKAPKGSTRCLCNLVPKPGAHRMKGLFQRIPESLKNLGPDPEDARRKPGFAGGLRNLGATCYANAVLQTIYSIQDLRRGVYQCNVRDPIMLQLRELLASMQGSVRAASDPSPLLHALQINVGEQQDSQEFWKLLGGQWMEDHLGQSNDPQCRTIVQDLFKGQKRHVTTCLGCGREAASSLRMEDYYELDLVVRGHKTLEDSIRSYLGKEKLEGESQYLCDHCAAKSDATREVKLCSLPPYLCCLLKRFEVSWNAKTMTLDKKKVKERLEFPLALDMGTTVKGTDCADALAACQDGLEYELAAVLIHVGSDNAGHYTAIIRDEASGSWWSLDDEKVTCTGASPSGPGVKDARDKSKDKDKEDKDGVDIVVVDSPEKKKGVARKKGPAAGDGSGSGRGRGRGRGRGGRGRKPAKAVEELFEGSDAEVPVAEDEVVTVEGPEEGEPPIPGTPQATPAAPTPTPEPLAGPLERLVSGDAYMLLYRRKGFAGIFPGPVEIPEDLRPALDAARASFDAECAQYRARREGIATQVEKRQRDARSFYEAAAGGQGAGPAAQAVLEVPDAKVEEAMVVDDGEGGGGGAAGGASGASQPLDPGLDLDRLVALESGWVTRFLESEDAPEPPSAQPLTCEHGRLDPRSASLRFVDAGAYDVLRQSYAPQEIDRPLVLGQSYCVECIRAVLQGEVAGSQQAQHKHLMAQQAAALLEATVGATGAPATGKAKGRGAKRAASEEDPEILVENGRGGRAGPGPGSEESYLLSRKWFQAWAKGECKAVRSAKAKPDAPSPSSALRCEHGRLRPDVGEGKRIAVPQHVWDFIVEEWDKAGGVTVNAWEAEHAPMVPDPSHAPTPTPAPQTGDAELEAEGIVIESGDVIEVHDDDGGRPRAPPGPKAANGTAAAAPPPPLVPLFCFPASRYPASCRKCEHLSEEFKASKAETKEVRSAERDQLKALLSERVMDMEPGQRYLVVPKDWMNDWKQYLQDPTKPRPNHLALVLQNMRCACTQGLVVAAPSLTQGRRGIWTLDDPKGCPLALLEAAEFEALAEFHGLADPERGLPDARTLAVTVTVCKGLPPPHFPLPLAPGPADAEGSGPGRSTQGEPEVMVCDGEGDGNGDGDGDAIVLASPQRPGPSSNRDSLAPPPPIPPRFLIAPPPVLGSGGGTRGRGGKAKGPADDAPCTLVLHPPFCFACAENAQRREMDLRLDYVDRDFAVEVLHRDPTAAGGGGGGGATAGTRRTRTKNRANVVLSHFESLYTTKLKLMEVTEINVLNQRIFHRGREITAANDHETTLREVRVFPEDFDAREDGSLKVLDTQEVDNNDVAQLFAHGSPGGQGRPRKEETGFRGTVLQGGRRGGGEGEAQGAGMMRPSEPDNDVEMLGHEEPGEPVSVD